jgi:hypothetical protein
MIRSIAVTVCLLSISATVSSQDDFSIKMSNGYATVKNDGQNKFIEVGWQTTLEKGFEYYVLQRSLPEKQHSVDTSDWRDLSRIDTMSTSDTIKTYKFNDYPSAPASYGYRVKIFINDTPRVYINFASVPAWALTGVEALTNQNNPVEYDCLRSYPNPFNPTTTIVVDLKTQEHGSMRIYDLGGRMMETLVEGSLSKGVHRFRWNASRYPSGTYFCVLWTQRKTTTTKLVFQK